MADNDGWGRPDGEDPTREFRPEPGGGQNQNLQWGQAAGGQPDWGQPPQTPQQPQYEQRKGAGAGTVLLVAVPLLIIILVATLLIWKWDDLFGSGGGDDDNAAPPPAVSRTEETEEAPVTSDETEQPEETSSAARPDSPDLPPGAEAVNDAARNNEPTGDFNSVYKSPQSGTTYTSDEFALAVRDAFVEAYLDNRDTGQTLDVRSPVTGDSYRMTCTDEGSYVHCTGGNDANVYIA